MYGKGGIRMTEEDIVKTIATEIMGWNFWPDTDNIHTAPDQGPVCYYRNEEGQLKLFWFDTGLLDREFRPLTDDNDCMRAWDKFSDMDGFMMALIERQSNKTWSAEIWIDNEIAQEVNADNPDRKRAMCECMAKAVS